MTKTFQAVYENGVLRPAEPLDGLQENEVVTVTIEDPTKPHPLEGWVGGMSDDDAAEMQRVIAEEFERVDPNDWK